jgi:mono/diheme cytochrome c family protein
MNRPSRCSTSPLATAALAAASALAVVAVMGACASGAAPPPADSPESAPATADSAPPTSVLDGVYTQAQAARGREVFLASCLECHTTRDFRGETFFLSWAGTTVGRFVDSMVETMPEDNPGGLPVQDYLDVTAYVLELNGYPVGSGELEDRPERLAAIRIERPATGAEAAPGGRQ